MHYKDSNWFSVGGLLSNNNNFNNLKCNKIYFQQIILDSGRTPSSATVARRPGTRKRTMRWRDGKQTKYFQIRGESMSKMSQARGSTESWTKTTCSGRLYRGTWSPNESTTMLVSRSSRSRPRMCHTKASCLMRTVSSLLVKCTKAKS